MTNHARAHPHQAPRGVRLERYATQMAAGMNQAIRHAAEMEEVMAKLVLRLNITTDEARSRLEQVRRDRPLLRLTEAYRLVLHSEQSAFADAGSVTAWFDRELQRPKSSAHFRTVLVLDKPYHWRQDYTGQLKLAAGASPW